MMTTGGSKSYYDDYMRKQGSEKASSDPSSLQSDRGAYVNFLEVQLERVSAACLGVQSYDQRFIDMQSLVVALENKCGQTTRLLALSQQCIEEIRLEANQSLLNMAKEIKEDQKNMLSSFDAISVRLGVAERSIASMAGLQPQIAILEKRIATDANNTSIAAKSNEESHQVLHDRLSAFTSAISETSARQENTNSIAKKLVLDVEELDRKCNTQLAAAEIRLRDELESDKNEISKKMLSIHAKIASETERVQKEIDKREHAVISNSRLQFDDMTERLDNTKKFVLEELDRKCARITENSAEYMKSFKSKLKNQFTCVDAAIDKLQQNQVAITTTGSLAMKEDFTNLQMQQKTAKIELESIKEEISLIISKANNAEVHRVTQENDVQKDLNKLKKIVGEYTVPNLLGRGPNRIAEISGVGIPNNFMVSGSMHAKEFSDDGVKSENISNFSLDSKQNLNFFLNESRLSKEDLMDIFANVIANAKESPQSSGIHVGGDDRRGRDPKTASKKIEHFNRSESDSEYQSGQESSSSSSSQFEEEYDERENDERDEEPKHYHKTSYEKEQSDLKNKNRKEKKSNKRRDRGPDSTSHESDSRYYREKTIGNKNDDADSKNQRSGDQGSRGQAIDREPDTRGKEKKYKSSKSECNIRIESSVPMIVRDAERGLDDSDRMPSKRNMTEKQRHPSHLQARKNGTLEGSSAATTARREGKAPHTVQYADPGSLKVAFRSDVREAPYRVGRYGGGKREVAGFQKYNRYQSPSSHSETDDSTATNQVEDINLNEGEGTGSEYDPDHYAEDSENEMLEGRIDMKIKDEDVRGDSKHDDDENGNENDGEDYYLQNEQALQAARDVSGSYLPPGYRQSLSYHTKGSSKTPTTNTSNPSSGRIPTQNTTPHGSPPRGSRSNGPRNQGSPNTNTNTPQTLDRTQEENVTPGSMYTVSTGGTRRLRDDPVREVLTKFLDIYLSDQDQLKIRFQQLLATTGNGKNLRSQTLKFHGNEALHPGPLDRGIGEEDQIRNNNYENYVSQNNNGKVVTSASLSEVTFDEQQNNMRKGTRENGEYHPVEDSRNYGQNENNEEQSLGDGISSSSSSLSRSAHGIVVRGDSGYKNINQDITSEKDPRSHREFPTPIPIPPSSASSSVSASASSSTLKGMGVFTGQNNTTEQINRINTTAPSLSTSSPSRVRTEAQTLDQKFHNNREKSPASSPHKSVSIPRQDYSHSHSSGGPHRIPSPSRGLPLTKGGLDHSSHTAVRTSVRTFTPPSTSSTSSPVKAATLSGGVGKKLSKVRSASLSPSRGVSAGVLETRGISATHGNSRELGHEVNRGLSSSPSRAAANAASGRVGSRVDKVTGSQHRGERGGASSSQSPSRGAAKVREGVKNKYGLCDDRSTGDRVVHSIPPSTRGVSVPMSSSTSLPRAGPFSRGRGDDRVGMASNKTQQNQDHNRGMRERTASPLSPISMKEMLNKEQHYNSDEGQPPISVATSGAVDASSSSSAEENEGRKNNKLEQSNQSDHRTRPDRDVISAHTEVHKFVKSQVESIHNQERANELYKRYGNPYIENENKNGIDYYESGMNSSPNNMNRNSTSDMSLSDEKVGDRKNDDIVGSNNIKKGAPIIINSEINKMSHSGSIKNNHDRNLVNNSRDARQSTMSDSNSGYSESKQNDVLSPRTCKLKKKIKTRSSQNASDAAISVPRIKVPIGPLGPSSKKGTGPSTNKIPWIPSKSTSPARSISRNRTGSNTASPLRMSREIPEQDPSTSMTSLSCQIKNKESPILVRNIEKANKIMSDRDTKNSQDNRAEIKESVVSSKLSPKPKLFRSFSSTGTSTVHSMRDDDECSVYTTTTTTSIGRDGRSATSSSKNLTSTRA